MQNLRTGPFQDRRAKFAGGTSRGNPEAFEAKIVPERFILTASELIDIIQNSPSRAVEITVVGGTGTTLNTQRATVCRVSFCFAKPFAFCRRTRTKNCNIYEESNIESKTAKHVS